MRKLREISDRDIERLLSGEALGDGDLSEVASHLRNLRAFSARIPGEEVESRHVAALVTAARNRAHGAAPPGTAPSARTGRGFVYRTKVFVARVAAAAVALSGATAGLAYAGVDLPGQAAEKAFEAVLKVELPNQGGDDAEKSSGAGAVADRVHAVIEAWGEDERGCAFGQAVAATARGEDSNRGPETDPCPESEDDGAKETKAPKGSKARGEEKSSAGKANAEEKSSAGKANAEEKSSAGKATGEEQSSAGKAKAEEKSSAGKAKAEEKSSDGRSNQPEDTGKP